MEMILIYPVFIGMSVAVAELARQRGYSARWWFLINTVLPIIAILILLILPKKERKDRKMPKEPNWAKPRKVEETVLFKK